MFLCLDFQSWDDVSEFKIDVWKLIRAFQYMTDTAPVSVSE